MSLSRIGKTTGRPKRGRQGEGPNTGRPRADAAKVAEGLRLVDDEQVPPVEAAERAGIGEGTLRRAMQARAGALARAVDVTEEVESEGLSLPQGVVGLVFHRADPAKVSALRALVTAGGPDGLELGADFVTSVAVGEECSAAEVRALLLEAAAEARLDVLPYELAVERSISRYQRALTKADNANDPKGIVMAQQAIDRLRFGKKEQDPEGLTRAEVLILLRRMVGAVQGIAGAVDALRAALAEDE